MTIRDVKCFREVSLDLNGESALIIGINGRGKTTLAQLIALGLTGSTHPNEIAGIHNLRRFGADASHFELKYLVDAPSTLSCTVDHNDVISIVPPFPRDLPGRTLIAAYGPDRRVARGGAPEREPFDSVASLFATGQLKHVRDSAVYERLSSGFRELKDLINRLFKLADDAEQPVELHDFNTRTFLFRTPTDREGRTSLEALSDGPQRVHRAVDGAWSSLVVISRWRGSLGEEAGTRWTTRWLRTRAYQRRVPGRRTRAPGDFPSVERAPARVSARGR